MSFQPVVKAWIWVSTLASAAGWILSAFGALDRTGYLLAVAAIAVGWFLLTASRSSGYVRRIACCNWRKVRTRFRHFLPAMFLVIAGAAFLGGALYAPTNHAGLTYRVPRVLEWLSEGHWHWIHTNNYRMNDRACGMEWLSAPLLLFTRSDRALFILNFIPFLLLPGLVYSVFTRLGVRRHVAWTWMWLVPTGYNFLLQAGSVANDTFPTVYALAAVDFALRARVSRKPSDLWYSLLAAALLTGAKASNMPLLLPWALLVCAMPRLWFVRPAASAFFIVLALLVSFVPTAVLNQVYCGDWSGLKMERAGMEMHSPLVGIWGNALLFLLHNFVPPFFPQAGWWNQSALSVLPSSIVDPMKANFEAGFHLLWEMPTEDWVGLGFGLSVLALAACVASLLHRNRDCQPTRSSQTLPGWLRKSVLLSPWLALLVYCIKSGMVTGARIISPYYPLLLPSLLAGCRQKNVVRAKWFRFACLIVVTVALVIVVLTPPRPLWPALTVLAELSEVQPGQRLLERATRVYTVYRGRSDPLAAVRALLPPQTAVVGFLADGDDMDLSLRRPFFQRKVRHVRLNDSPEFIRQAHIDYIVVGGAYLEAQNVQLQDWLRRMGGQVIAETKATIKVTEGPQPWYVVRLKESP